MLRGLLWIAAGTVVLLFPAQTPCHRFAVSLQLHGPGKQRHETTHTDTYPSRDKARSRPIVEIKAGSKSVVRWKAENTSGDDAFENVLIHFFLVKQDQPGQQRVPDLGKDVMHEGALTMDFKPQDKSSGMFTFKIDQPGSFLLRVETRYMAELHGHDHFAAMDIVVKE